MSHTRQARRKRSRSRSPRSNTNNRSSSSSHYGHSSSTHSSASSHHHSSSSSSSFHSSDRFDKRHRPNDRMANKREESPAYEEKKYIEVNNSSEIKQLSINQKGIAARNNDPPQLQKAWKHFHSWQNQRENLNVNADENKELNSAFELFKKYLQLDQKKIESLRIKNKSVKIDIVNQSTAQAWYGLLRCLRPLRKTDEEFSHLELNIANSIVNTNLRDQPSFPATFKRSLLLLQLMQIYLQQEEKSNHYINEAYRYGEKAAFRVTDKNARRIMLMLELRITNKPLEDKQKIDNCNILLDEYGIQKDLQSIYAVLKAASKLFPNVAKDPALFTEEEKAALELIKKGNALLIKCDEFYKPYALKQRYWWLFEQLRQNKDIPEAMQIIKEKKDHPIWLIEEISNFLNKEAGNPEAALQFVEYYEVNHANLTNTDKYKLCFLKANYCRKALLNEKAHEYYKTILEEAKSLKEARLLNHDKFFEENYINAIIYGAKLSEQTEKYDQALFYLNHAKLSDLTIENNNDRKLKLAWFYYYLAINDLVTAQAICTTFPEEKKQNKEELMAVGDLKRKSGNVKAALECFAVLKNVYPKDIAILSQYAISLKLMGDLTEAIAVFKQILQDHEYNFHAQLELAKCYHAVGDKDAVIKTINNYFIKAEGRFEIKKYKDILFFLIGSGYKEKAKDIYLDLMYILKKIKKKEIKEINSNKDFEKIIPEIAAVLFDFSKKDNTYFDFLLSFFSLLKETQFTTMACNLAKEYLNRFKGENYISLKKALGNFYETLGQFNNAYNTFNELFEQLSHENLITAIPYGIYAISILLKMYQYNKALNFALKLEKQRPNDITILRIKAKCYTLLREEIKGDETYKQLFKLAGDNNKGIDVKLNYSTFLIKQHNFFKAAEELLTLSETSLDKNDSMRLIHIVSTLLNNRQVELRELREDCLYLIEKQAKFLLMTYPESVETDENIIRYASCARIKEFMGKPIAYYYNHSPSVTVTIEYTHYLMIMKNFSEAKKIAQQSKQLYKDNVKIIENAYYVTEICQPESKNIDIDNIPLHLQKTQGIIYYKKANFINAATFLHNYIKNSMSACDANVYLLLYSAYTKLNEDKEAESILEQALALFPNYALLQLYLIQRILVSKHYEEDGNAKIEAILKENEELFSINPAIAADIESLLQNNSRPFYRNKSTVVRAFPFSADNKLVTKEVEIQKMELKESPEDDKLNNALNLNNINFPEQVTNIFTLLGGKHYKTYLVGGYVRHLLLEKDCNITDVDFVTNAPVERLLEYFPQGHINTYKTNLFQLKLPNLKIDFFYNPNLEDLKEDALKEDALKRDTYISALYIGEDKKVLDPLNKGIDDLKDGALDIIPKANTNKEVKDASDDGRTAKLKEDPTRILRLVKLSIDYDISLLSLNAIKNAKESMQDISSRHLFSILNSLFQKGKIIAIFNKLCELELFTILFPYSNPNMELSSAKYKNSTLGKWVLATLESFEKINADINFQTILNVFAIQACFYDGNLQKFIESAKGTNLSSLVESYEANILPILRTWRLTPPCFDDDNNIDDLDVSFLLEKERKKTVIAWATYEKACQLSLLLVKELQGTPNQAAFFRLPTNAHDNTNEIVLPKPKL